MTRPAGLTSDLLARKGQALPTAAPACPRVEIGQSLPALPAPDKPSSRRASIAVVGGAPERRSGRARQAYGSGSSGRRDERIALTLRLDRERHRRLRILAARHDCTSQEVIVAALDAYLAACSGDCACLRGGPEGSARS
jgi:hypothetical protein